MNRPWYSVARAPLFRVGIVVVGVVVAAQAVYGWYYADRISPHTWVGDVALGGLTRDQATVHLQAALDRIEEGTIRLSVDGTPETIDPGSIGLDLNIQRVVDAAFARGHQGGVLHRAWDRTVALWLWKHQSAPLSIDQGKLQAQLEQINQVVGTPRRDVRLAVQGSSVKLLTDTAPGRSINEEAAAATITAALEQFRDAPITIALVDDVPVADPATGPAAVTAAEKIIAYPLTLQYQEAHYSVSISKIASWVTNQYSATKLEAGLDRVAIASYVTSLASLVNIPPTPPQIQTVDGRVTSFTPAKVGTVVQQDQLVGMIVDALSSRASGNVQSSLITIPVTSTAMELSGLDSSAGITEIIGKATTPFTGSPKNRILNIKNGVRFLSGTVVQPGEEFSTLQTLGTIDNTTGYLPELVIKGDRTLPEFGGGLCQVSTTLFRAVLNAGLPVTERVNHSYRVSYYEKDGNGNTIGPGLDATIYDPDPDFKFRNDTDHAILIIGTVTGDKVTFELYGTRDGRVATIDGPYTLSETPSGDPKYIDDPDLPVGTTQRVESPHPGGSAIATYLVTYADGTTNKQVFRSYYRPWPAQYLVGTAGATPLPSPSATVGPVP